MERERLVKKIYRAEVDGNRGRGRPRRRWMDGVKGCLNDRGLSIPEAKECVKDRREWRRIVGGATKMIQGEARCMKQLKLWMFFDLLRSGI